MNSITRNPIVQGVRRLLGPDAVCRLQVAALPWRLVDGKVEILLITSRDTGRWVVPKGWPEAGEEFCDSAAREAFEEAGLSGSVSRREAGRYFYAKSRASGDALPCEVLVYPLEVDRLAEKWKEKRQRRRRWASAAEAARMVSEPDLSRLITEFSADPRKFG